jgi:hypothetical protein
MGSSHRLGPWSVMQAALQGGAAASRPSVPVACGRPFLSLVRASAVADNASDGTSSSAARKHFVFIVRLLDCEHVDEPRRTNLVRGTALR